MSSSSVSSAQSVSPAVPIGTGTLRDTLSPGIPRVHRLITLLALIASALAASATIAHAQAPHLPHRTLTTEHFRVHYETGLEPLARRAAASAERAYARLAAELVAPRGPIDLVVSDNVDYANGSATVFPSNRITVYAHPPIESAALRFTDDWIDLVVTHELAHIFHIDRSRGTWRLLQNVFGRSPMLFPNAYTPRWLTEGIATYYESHLTGAGRIAGTNHRSYLLAAGAARRFPRIDQVSIATPVFPGGQGVYIFGSLFVDYLAETHGDSTVRELIERQAVHPLPFMLNRVARAATGQGFTAAWDDFTDLNAGPLDSLGAVPMPGWRDVGRPLHSADFLRWMPDGRLVYTGSAPRRLYGAYALTPAGTDGSSPGAGASAGQGGSPARATASAPAPHARFLGRRNGATPHSRAADGTLVYAQPDFVDPYTVRGDLYLERNGRRQRATRGARISAPDVRADGRVVAVQAVAGGSRLVTYDIPTRALAPLTGGGLDEFWAEPRWSPDGRAIAASRWRRGGATSIAIVDAASGSVREEISIARAVQASPSWSADGRAVLFSSDRGGSTQIYVADVGSGRAPRVLSTSAIGVFDPQLSPDGQTLAAVRLTAEGMRVGVAPATSVSTAPPGWQPVELAPRPARADTVAPFDGAVRRYSPLRQLVPRYWFPVYEDDGRDTRAGASTSSSDILGRHSYFAQVAAPLRGRGVEGGFAYQFAGLKRPVLGLSAWQSWSYRGAVLDQRDVPIARVDRVDRDASLSATFARPRVRSNLSLTLSAGAQLRRNDIDPDVPTNATPAFFVDSLLPRVTAGIGYARTRNAPYAISPEDGFTAAVGAINRWVAGHRAPSSRTVTGAVTGYRSFDLGGYARHVAALRVAGGAADDNTVTELEAGGVSGTAIPLALGFGTIGEGRRTFPVRGFAPRTLHGTRAWAASAEYRAPLALFARGAGVLPLFVDRTSISAFADAASAWCPVFRAGLCAQGNPRATIASAGAEARLTAALGSWDQPFAFRMGVAIPVVERERTRAATVYFSSGLSF